VSAFEQWSDLIFLKAVWDASGSSLELTERLAWALLKDFLWQALQDPKNWKRVRIRRDPKTREQAARVTRALRRGKPGELIWL